MSDEDLSVAAYRPGLGKLVKDHLAQYCGSGGREGHIIDSATFRNPRFTPTLVLQTRGRRTGKLRRVPLGYGLLGPEWVLIGTKGGTPEHPAWYLNLLEQDECEMRVATQVFRCSWREAQGEERQRAWDYMCELYPLVERYERVAANRQIPVIMLLPLEELPEFTGEAEWVQEGPNLRG
jgi:deazaflavin-dependent oxidoreductase (nitroreductase family)